MIENHEIKPSRLEGLEKNWKLGVIIFIASVCTGGIVATETELFSGITEVKSEVAEVQSPPNPFESLDLEAKSVFVFDIKNQRVLYSSNEDMILPLASLSKVLAAVVATDLVPNHTIVTINKNFLLEDGDSGLFAGERWLLKDLLDFSLVTSSNDGIAAIAAVVGSINAGVSDFDIGRENFVSKMNEKATEIGMMNSRFLNEGGLDLNATSSGAYGSARDVATLFAYALKNYPLLLVATKSDKIQVKSLDGISHEAKNTDLAIPHLPGLLASKTGYTDLSGGNLVVVFDPEIGRPIIVSLLGSGYKGRFDDAVKLVDAIMNLVALGG